MNFTDILVTACLATFFVFLFMGLMDLFMATANFLADKWLRRTGWDEGDEFQPMRDYVPFWCLFTGVDHLTKPKRFNRQI